MPRSVLVAAMAFAALGAEESEHDSVFLLQTALNMSAPRAVGLTQTDSSAQSEIEAALSSSLADAISQGARRVSMRSAAAEYIAMTLFVIIGCGSAMSIARDEGSAWTLQVALAFGIAITVLAYSLGRYSGGQINCAVTLALWVSGDLSFAQAAVNFAFQMLGSVTGATILCIVYPKGKDKTGDIATNAIAFGFSHLNVLLGEFAMTFLLVLVVLESSLQTSPASGIATIPIGFAVFLAHCVLIHVDGCSINPTRSFGPALLASVRDRKGDYFKDMWVFWVGPLLGALAAAGVHALFGL